MATSTQSRKVSQTWSFRGSKSRNKVSVGEPAEGSLESSTPKGVPPSTTVKLPVASAALGALTGDRVSPPEAPKPNLFCNRSLITKDLIR